MNFNFYMKKKGFIAGEYPAWLIIAVIVLALMLMAYFIFGDKSGGAVEYLKRLLRFG